MGSGESPIGAAKGKQPNTEALCPPPPPCPTNALANKHCRSDHSFFGAD